jgi:ABC-type polar amino acid transport system ATPase subunit
MVHCNNITVRHRQRNQDVIILDNISLVCNPGEITCLLGPSGAGKTTLLRTIAQLHDNYYGSIMINEKDIKTFMPVERSAMVGLVFQHFNLFPHLTVMQNCMQPMMVVQAIPSETAQQRVCAILTDLNIGHLASYYPAQLSGGQQQRVAIARALCLSPRILLLDEPTSALDPSNGILLQKLLRRLADQGFTIIVSSHDMHFVQGILDRGYLIEEGKISQSFDADCLASPVNNSRLAQFLNEDREMVK